MSWWARYVGRPYSEDGRSGGGLHCWSLIAQAYREELKKELPHYGETSARGLIAIAHRISDDSLRDPWVTVPTEDARPFDIVVMAGRVKSGEKTHRKAMHCGVMIDCRRVLHIERSTDAVIVGLTHPSIRFRLLRIVRHKDLA